MSDDNKGVRGPAAKLTTSEKWGDPSDLEDSLEFSIPEPQP